MTYLSLRDLTAPSYSVSSQVLLTLICILVPWLLWRMWTFTILPMIHPDEPKHLPYSIPYLGHTISFFNDADRVLTYARTYFGNTREPFSVTLAGETMTILTSASDAATACKNTSSLNYDKFVQGLFHTFGVSTTTTQRLYQNPKMLAKGDRSKSLLQNENPLQKCLIHLNSDIYKQQLYPGEKLNVLQRRFLEYIDTSLRWNTLSSFCVSAPASNEVPCKEPTFSLYKWCREVLIDAATRTFFGDILLEIDPAFTQHFNDFERNSWKLPYQYPQIFAKDVHAAKSKMLDTLMTYLSLPKEQRSDASWLIQTLENEQREICIPDRDIAALIVMGYWVINANAHKLTFWILSYILHSPSLIPIIITETAPAIQPSAINMPFLLSSCPHLDSLYNEVLRLTNSAASIRTVESPTIIGGKTLRPGTKVLSPFRQMHFDEDVFGEDALKFNADRFFTNEGLARSKSYRPFGGGTKHCPGRFVARQEVYMFVVVVLHRFEIGLAAGGQVFPRLETKKPNFGVMGPVDGSDCFVSVKLRASSK